MPDAVAATLVALTGLPGCGKTTLARALAAELGAVHVRIDVIETALDTVGAVSLRDHPAAGYVVGYALAADHLRAGTSVIADSVNPIAITRDAWRGVGLAAGARVLEVHVVCSDVGEHRRRVESREADIPGHVQPTWEDVTSREFEPLAPGPDVLEVDMLAGVTGPLRAVTHLLAEPSVGPYER